MKYSKQFSVDSKFISKLIGPNGVNIKAISFSKDVHKNRPNSKCFIEFKNNICYINTTHEDSIDVAFKLLQENILKLKNNDLIHINNKPKNYINCSDSNIIAMVIGKRGCGIRDIVSKIKNGCYIIHKNDKFEVSANTNVALQDATILLKQKIDDITNYFKFNTNNIINKPKNDDSKRYSGRFDSLMEDSIEKKSYRKKRYIRYITQIDRENKTRKNLKINFKSSNEDFPTLSNSKTTLKTKTKTNSSNTSWGSGNISIVKNKVEEFKPLKQNPILNNDKVYDENDELYYSEIDIKNTIGCKMGNINYSNNVDEFDDEYYDDSIDYHLNDDFYY